MQDLSRIRAMLRRPTLGPTILLTERRMDVLAFPHQGLSIATLLLEEAGLFLAATPRRPRQAFNVQATTLLMRSPHGGLKL